MDYLHWHGSKGIGVDHSPLEEDRHDCPRQETFARMQQYFVLQGLGLYMAVQKS